MRFCCWWPPSPKEVTFEWPSKDTTFEEPFDTKLESYSNLHIYSYTVQSSTKTHFQEYLMYILKSMRFFTIILDLDPGLVYRFTFHPKTTRPSHPSPRFRIGGGTSMTLLRCTARFLEATATGGDNGFPIGKATMNTLKHRPWKSMVGRLKNNLWGTAYFQELLLF